MGVPRHLSFVGDDDILLGVSISWNMNFNIFFGGKRIKLATKPARIKATFCTSGDKNYHKQELNGFALVIEI